MKEVDAELLKRLSACHENFGSSPEDLDPEPSPRIEVRFLSADNLANPRIFLKNNATVIKPLLRAGLYFFAGFSAVMGAQSSSVGDLACAGSHFARHLLRIFSFLF